MKKSIIKANLLESSIKNLENTLLEIKSRRAGNNNSISLAVSHFHRFLELSFKYFLQHIDPNLIYEKQKNNYKKIRTINAKKAIKKFKEINGISILDYEDMSKDSFEKDLELINDARNDIEHNVYNFDQNKITVSIGRMLNKIDSLFFKHDIFLMNELSLKTKNLYKDLLSEDSRLIVIADADANSMLNEAPKQFDPNLLKTPCPECGKNYFILDTNSRKYICTLCDNISEIILSI